MNISQEQLLSLLKMAINGGDLIDESLSNINVDELFKYALQHNVYAFLYPTIQKHYEALGFDELIISRWKNTTLCTVAQQARMTIDIKTVLSLFDVNSIPVIFIKGLVLKNLYPSPELRSMGDMDLFIDEEDMQRSIEILTSHGYKSFTYDLKDPGYMEIEMRKFSSLSVELHRTLWHPTIMNALNDQSWLNHVWENKRLVKMEDFQFTALSIEDEFINLIVHLAKHLMHSSAQLRQICDFALFVKKYWEMLNLEYIEETIKSMDLYKFYHYLITICNLYLGLDIPINADNIQKRKAKKLLNLIFDPPKQYKHKEQNQGRNLMGKLVISLKRFSFVRKTHKFIKQWYTKKARLLNSIGLYNNLK